MEEKVIKIESSKNKLCRKCTACGKETRFVLTLGNTRYSNSIALCNECFGDLVKEINDIKKIEMMINGITYMSNELDKVPLTKEEVEKMDIEEILKLHKKLLKKVLKRSDLNGK